MRDSKQMTAAVLERRDAYVQAQTKRKRVAYITLPLACVAAVAIGAGVWLFPASAPSPIIVSEYPANTDPCYTAPSPGHYFCYIEVNEARAHNEHSNHVVYLLTFDLFDENGFASHEQFQDEFKRLSRLGYRFYTSPQTKDVLCLLTEQQLSAFDVNEQYGYAFHFAYTDDGTPIDSDSITPVSFE